jgi:hypothetical protein
MRNYELKIKSSTEPEKMKTVSERREDSMTVDKIDRKSSQTGSSIFFIFHS